MGVPRDFNSPKMGIALTRRSRMPPPIALTNSRLAASTDTLAGLLAPLRPLRPLLSTKNEQEKAAKSSLTTAPTSLTHTNPHSDASRQGLGFVLQQKHGDNWVLVQAGSRFLSDKLELEVTWAITKCKIFLAGLPHFTVVTSRLSLTTIH